MDGTPRPSAPVSKTMDSADGDNVYEVTVTVSDGVARSSQAVLVTVTNKEEPGKITLSQRRPQEGIAITARLTDPDGNITDTQVAVVQGKRPHRHLHHRRGDRQLLIEETVSTLRIDDRWSR